MRARFLALLFMISAGDAVAQTPPTPAQPAQPPLATPDYPLPRFPANPRPSIGPANYDPSLPNLDAVPAQNQARWVTSDDYPAAAIKQELDGRVSYSLTVGKDGRAAACEISQSSGVQQLDTATCQLLLRRSRFYPATDAKGQPVDGVYAKAVIWRLPISVPRAQTAAVPPLPIGDPAAWLRDPLPAKLTPKAVKRGEILLSGLFYFQLNVDAMGRVATCAPFYHRFSRKYLDVLNASKTCAILQQTAQFVPGKDADGAATPGVYFAFAPVQFVCRKAKKC